ncbi:hypothetical protein GCM10018987_13600 [Streptomyces cremeus]
MAEPVGVAAAGAAAAPRAPVASSETASRAARVLRIADMGVPSSGRWRERRIVALELQVALFVTRYNCLRCEGSIVP